MGKVVVVLRFIFTYSTVTGRKCEINIIVIVIVVVLKFVEDTKQPYL